MAHLRPESRHHVAIQLDRGPVLRPDQRLIFHVLGLHVAEIVPGLTSSGRSRKSSMVIAITLAPAVAPLCAIGVAMEIAFAQLWPGRPGMFDGKRSVTVGTFHDTSPMSSEPPPMRSFGLSGGRRLSSVVASPESGTPSSCWRALARRWSASLHCGNPTCLMFSYMSSATTRLKWPGHAEPRMRMARPFQ